MTFLDTSLLLALLSRVTVARRPINPDAAVRARARSERNARRDAYAQRVREAEELRRLWNR